MNNDDTTGETLRRLPFPPQVIGIAGSSHAWSAEAESSAVSPQVGTQPHQ